MGFFLNTNNEVTVRPRTLVAITIAAAAIFLSYFLIKKQFT